MEEYGLKPQILQGIKEVFERYPKIECAVLYGSRAKGNYRPNSDIDLTLKGEHLDLSVLIKIENELDDLLLPYKIDLSILNQIKSPELLDHIERVGKVIYNKI